MDPDVVTLTKHRSNFNDVAWQYFEELGKDVIVEGLKSGQIVNGLREIQSKLSQEAAEWNAVDCLSPKLKQIVTDLQAKVIPVHLFGQSLRIEWANPFAAHMIAKWKADGSLTALFKSPSFMKVVSGLQSEDSNKQQHIHTLATHIQAYYENLLVRLRELVLDAGEYKESSLRVVEESAFSAWRDKKYDVAIRRYKQACEMCPENIKYLTRTAEIYFEQQKYEECVDQCVKAIDRGTEHNAYWEDVNEVFTLLGKAQYQIKKAKNRPVQRT